jgi:outer membrane cobalamin receptor
VFKKYLVQTVILLLLSLSSSLVSAKELEPDSLHNKTLKEVTVNGKNIQIARAALPEQLKTEEEISTLNATNVADVAKHFSGVTVKDYGGIGGLKTISVRGLGAAHTGICYDGVLMSDMQTGQVDLSQFSIENISGVFLFNGQPNDILQPARMFSSASVLSFSTQMPDYDAKHTLSGHIALKAGSFGMYNPSFLFAKNLSEKIGISISANGEKANGKYNFLSNINPQGHNYIEKTRENSDVTSLRTEQNLIYRIRKNEFISLKNNQYYSERGLPGADIFYSTSATTDRLRDKNFFSQIQYENKVSGYLQYLFSAKYSSLNSKFTEINPNYSTLPNEMRIDNFAQHEYYLTSAVQYRPNTNFAFSSSLDWSRNDLFSNSNISFVADASPVRNTGLANFAGKYINERLTIGANMLYTLCYETSQTGTPSPNKYKWTPTVSISYKLFNQKEIRIRAFYKNIFRLPTFTDLYYHDFGYKDLRPEYTKQFNVGFTYIEPKPLFFNELECSIDGYYNRITDKITVVYGMPFSTVRNIGLVDIKGCDLNLKLGKALNKRINIQLNLNYSLQFTEDKDKNSVTFGSSLPYTPNNSGSASLSIRYMKLELGYNLLYAGTRNTGSINTSTLKPKLMTPYGDHNIYCKYSLGKFSINGEILNVSNTNYSIVDYYPMPGRNYRLSVNYKF